jgi:hypothetical protein
MLASIRESMAEHERPVALGDGVKILVSGEDVNAVFPGVCELRLLLYPRFVLVSPDLEPILMQTTAATHCTGLYGGKCKDNFRIKSRVELSLPTAPWERRDTSVWESDCDGKHARRSCILDQACAVHHSFGHVPVAGGSPTEELACRHAGVRIQPRGQEGKVFKPTQSRG